MIQYKVTIPQTHCTVVHVHVFQSTKKFGFAVSFLPHLATQQKERERVRKKAIHPFTSPDQVTVYILSCEFQNGYFFIHETFLLLSKQIKGGGYIGNFLLGYYLVFQKKNQIIN